MIQKHILDFLKELKVNNNKEWFDANRHRYEKARKDFETYINTLIPKIATFDSNLNALTAKETIFRIFRDVRFSKDKTPYKSNFGSYMTKGGRKGYFAGYYLHIEAGGSFLAGGIYMPEPPVLKAIRDEIFYNSDQIISIINHKDFKKYFKQIEGEKLKTAPKGYPKDYENIDLLKYKDYSLIHYMDDSVLSQKGFTDHILEIYKKMYPFNSFLNEAILDVDSSQLRC